MIPLIKVLILVDDEQTLKYYISIIFNHYHGLKIELCSCACFSKQALIRKISMYPCFHTIIKSISQSYELATPTALVS